MLMKLLASTGLISILFTALPAVGTQRTSDNSALVQELLHHAGAQMHAGELSSAERDLRKAVALAPNDVKALTMLGALLGMQRHLEESSRYLEKALQLSPANPDARRNLAANQLQLDRTADAIRNLQALLKSNPGDRQAVLLLGLAHEHAEDFSRAITFLEQVPELVKRQPDGFAALARSYYGTGQNEKARGTLLELRDSSSNPAVVYVGGQVALKAKDWDTAEKLFASIQSTHPKPSLVTYQLARIRLETGRFAEGRMLLEPIANSRDCSGSVLYLLAWCFLKEGDEGMAKKIFYYAIDKFPEEPANFVDLGKLCVKTNSLPEGLEVVKRGTARHPSSALLFELEGELESKQGLHAPAERSYRRAVQLNPRSPEALLGLALTQTNLLKTEDAVANFEKGLKLFPANARFYAEYGKVLLQPWASGEVADRDVKAETLLERAIQLDATLAMAHFELGSLLITSQRTAEALPHLEEAVKLDTHNAQAHYVLARAYRTLGRRQDAEREMLLFQNLQTAASGKESTPR